MTNEDFKIESGSERFRMMDNMYNVLKDGLILCKLIDDLLPTGLKLDFTRKAFQETKMQAFASARERERIAIFLNKAMEYGVPESCTFQTDYLYEKTNLVQVCTCIRALGIEAQSHPSYTGPIIWPKKAEENKRKFSNDQLNAGQQVISLQYGTNRGASQAGMNFGKQRMIID
ncbi:hypothetical protein FSP39_013008 [Pinctada imbricata]|uniref:Transgelin n=1 Tax=Pinctada imbricata TaxID=66713 RepID=A0AA88Y500_PINIB|nr:hypothetical protein FSP39_013008 [Pinctada imbricata]